MPSGRRRTVISHLHDRPRRPEARTALAVAVTAALSLMVLLTACGDDTTTATDTPSGTDGTDGVVDPDALEALSAARARWSQAGPADYGFTATRSCECTDEAAGPLRVHVVDTVAISTTYVGTPTNAGPGSVEDVFDDIEASIERGEQVGVAYDVASGFPARVRLDLESIPADGGLDLTLRDLVSYDELRAELADARAVWAAGATRSYDLTYRMLCFCPEIVVSLEVRDGTLVDRTIEGAPTTDLIDGVEDLFSQVEAAINSAAFAIEVTYEPAYGYPARLYVDPEEQLLDEEHGVEIVSFELR